MTESAHERARRLIAMDRIEGLPEADGQWLEAHLESCPACAGESAATANLLQGLRATPVPVDPALVASTRLKVRLRAVELRGHQARIQAVLVSCALSFVWMLLTTPYLWGAFARLGRRAGLADVLWQTAFLMAWFMPACIAGALLAWRHSRAVHSEIV